MGGTDDAEYWYRCGIERLERKRFLSARNALRICIEKDDNYPGAADALRQAEQLIYNPHLPKSSANLPKKDVRLRDGGSLHTVERTSSKATEAAPYNPIQQAPLTNIDLAHTLVARGLEFEASGQTDDAVVAYSAAIDADYNNAFAHNNLGAIFAARGDYIKAISLFDRALHIEANKAFCLNLGRALEKVGKLDEAESAYENSLIIDCTYRDAYEYFGNMLYANGRHAEAINLFMKAINLCGNFSMAHNTLGAIFDAIHEYESAEKYFTSAVVLERTPYNVFSLPCLYGGIFDGSSDYHHMANFVYWLSTNEFNDYLDYISASRTFAAHYGKVIYFLGRRLLKTHRIMIDKKAFSRVLVKATGSKPGRIYGISDIAGAHRALQELVAFYRDHPDDSRHLLQAIRLLKRARELLTDDDANLPGCLSDLARALFLLFRLERDGEALREARAICEDMIRRGEEAYLRDAMAEALGAADALFEDEDWAGASALYDLLADLGQWLRERSLVRPAQEAWLKVGQTMAPRAAYAWVQQGECYKAVVALERGLAALMRDELMVREAEVDGLRGDLALRYRDAVADWTWLFEHRLTPSVSLTGEADTSAAEVVADLRTARDRLDGAIAAIRADHSDFLQPPTLPDILAAARERPLVYFAYTPKKGGLAFVVDSEVTVVPFPHMTEEAVKGIAEGYLAAYARFRRAEEAVREAEKALREDEGSSETAAQMLQQRRQAWREALIAWLTTLDKALEWLWPAAMGPVLAVLKKRKIGSAVLVGGGLLRLFPLGAAFTTPWWSKFLFRLRHGAEPPPLAFPRRSYALDRVCLSTAPSAWSLLAAARVRQCHEGRGDSAVAYRWSEEGKEGFAQECAAAMAAFPERRTRITDGPKQRLVAALADHAVLQFSGHGETDFADPLNGAGLYLLDDYRRRTKLTVREILGLALNLRACILSACESGQEGRRDLAHEAIGLPAALLQAGCAAVIAPAWTVHNRATAHLLSRFHELWREMPDDPAQALRLAQLWLRRTLRREIAADGGLNLLSEEDAATGAEADGQDQPPPPIPPVIVGGAFDAVPLDHPFWWGAFACTGG